MPDEATPTLLQQRQALEAQLADISKQEAIADRTSLLDLQSKFADPAIDALLTAAKDAKLSNPTRQQNVANIIAGIGAMRDVVGHMIGEVNQIDPPAPPATPAGATE